MAELKEIYIETRKKFGEPKPLAESALNKVYCPEAVKPRPATDLVSDVESISDNQENKELDLLEEHQELKAEKITAIPPSFPIEFDTTIPQVLKDLRLEIQALREVEYDAETKSGERSVHIKYHREGINISGNPIAENEGHIQALRYLQGMLLICNNLPEKSQNSLREEITNIFKNYENQLNSKTYDHAAFALAEDFAGLLQTHLGINKSAAQKQVTMARDLGVMLEEHPDVCTITETAEHATIEYSRNLKISEHFYEEEIKKRDQRAWYTSAKSYAGLKGQNTWLDSFFEKHYDELKERGVSAPPSARWLPMPSNCQFVTTQVLNRANGAIATQSSFVRLGTVAPFEINSIAEQERLAEVALKEVIKNHIQEKIESYKRFYGDLAGDTFFVNYQTLLTPHFLETYLYPLRNIIPLFKDNNGRFVDMAKQAMANIADEIRKECACNGIKLQFHHTNASVNVRSDWITARNSNSDHSIRKLKLRETSSLLTKLAARIKNIESELPNQDKSESSNENKLTVSNQIEATSSNQSEVSPPKENALKKPIKFESEKLKEIIERKTVPSLVPEALEMMKDIDSCLEEIASYIDGKGELTLNLAIKMELLALTLECGGLFKDNPDILLQNEIALRMRSSFHLRNLINGNPATDRLNSYQRNLQMVALETHAMGKQALVIVGCKSARDRTAVFAGVLKAIQENVKAMYDWATAYKGIMSSLVQGHHVRSMNWHVSVVKASMVAKEFVKGVAESFKKSITAISFFSKKLGSLTSSVKKKLGEVNAPATIEVRVKKSSTGSLQASLSNVSAPSSPAVSENAMRRSVSMPDIQMEEPLLQGNEVASLRSFGQFPVRPEMPIAAAQLSAESSPKLQKN